LESIARNQRSFLATTPLRASRFETVPR